MTALADYSKALAELARATGESVARVEGPRRVASATVVGPKLLVTTARAVGDGEGLKVSFGQTTVPARLRGRDDGTDLALLEVDSALPPAIRFASALPAVGELAFHVARPGVSVRVASGVVGTVSEQAWQAPTGAELAGFIDTDAVVPRGFSGGPVVTAGGEAVGISSRGLLKGEGVVIPFTTVKRVVAQLEQHGRVRQSYLGVSMRPVRLPEDVAAATGDEVGLLVLGVAKDSPAAQAGLKYGDTILHLGSEDVRTVDDVHTWLRADHVGEQTRVRYWRDGAVQAVTVTLAARS